MPDENGKKKLLYIGGGGIVLALILFMMKGSSAGASASGSSVDASALNALYNSVMTAIESAVKGLREEFAGQLTTVQESVAAQGERVTSVEQQAGDIFNRQSALEESTQASINSLTATLTGLQNDITSLSEQAAQRVTDPTAAEALKQAAYARAENAWLTAVSVSGPNTSLSTMRQYRDQLLASTVAGLDTAQKAQWTAWVNSYIADRASRGQGGAAELSFLSPLTGGPVGYNPNIAQGASVPIDPANMFNGRSVRLRYGLKKGLSN